MHAPLDPATDHELYKEGLASYQSYRKHADQGFGSMWSLKIKLEGQWWSGSFLLFCVTWNIQENKSGYIREKICNLNDHCNDDCSSSLE